MTAVPNVHLYKPDITSESEIKEAADQIRKAPPPQF